LGEADVVVAIRERVNFSRALLERLPRLKLLALVGRNASTIDFAACTALGIPVSTGKSNSPDAPAELARQGVRKVFQGVAQRPGKPFWFGIGGRLTPVFALPGNPVSAYTCLHRYVLPALDHASGMNPRPHLLAALAGPVTFKPRLACLLPVRISSGPRAELLAFPGAVGSSGDFAGLVDTDGFVELPAEPDEFPEGTVAPFWSWV